MSAWKDLRKALRLIVLTDREMAGTRGVEGVVSMALDAGCRAIQLRDKSAGSADLLRTGQALRKLTADAGALFFVNDRLDVALACGADGVHLGPDDLPVHVVRALVPAGFLIGYSTDDPDEARRAEAGGADYLGCGAVRPTASKVDAGSPIGVEGVDRVAGAVAIPVVGIGGIGPDESRALAATRAAGVAVMGAVMTARHPDQAVRSLLAPFELRSIAGTH